MARLKGIPKDPEFVQHIATLIGHVVLNFALFEFALNGIIATTYLSLGGNKLEDEIPLSLSRCLRFVRKAARRLPGLLPDRAELLWIVGEASRLARVRHDIVHGYIAEYDESANHLLTFAKITADRKTKQIHEETLRRITAEELVKAGDDVMELAGRAAELSQGLLAATKTPRPVF